MTNPKSTEGSVTSSVEARFKLAQDVYATFTGDVNFSVGLGIGVAGASVGYLDGTLTLSGAALGFIGSIDIKFTQFGPSIGDVSLGVGGIVGLIAHGNLAIGVTTNFNGDLSLNADISGGAGVVSGSATISKETNLHEWFSQDENQHGNDVGYGTGATDYNNPAITVLLR